MALNTFNCNYLTSLHFNRLIITHKVLYLHLACC